MKYEILSLQNLNVEIAGQKALNGISLRMFEDELTFVIGNPNGGKTLLTRVLNGEMNSSSGSIIMDGQPYDPVRAAKYNRSNIYTITDQSPLMEEMTIAENIGLAAPPFSVSLNYRRKLSAYVQTLCEDNGIDLDVERKARNLPPLERLKIHCARAMMRRVRVIVFNSVLYLLSDPDISQLMILVRSLMRRGMGVMFLEPIPKYAVRYADRIHVIASGCLRMSYVRGEADAAEIEQILAAGETYSGMTVRRERTAAPVHRIRLQFPVKDGTKSFMLNSGQIYGVSCYNAEDYYWILNSIIRKKWPQLYRASGASASIRCVTYPDLQNGTFDLLSVAENIALPAAKPLSAHGFLSPGRYKQFLKSEFSGVLEPVLFDWKTRLYSVRTWYRMQTVLFRSLLNNSDVLLLCGILDQPNPGLRRLVETVAVMAADRSKAVLILGRSREELSEWCDEMILI